MGKSIHTLLGGELSFLKLDSVLVGLSGGMLNLNFSSKPTYTAKLIFLRSNVSFGL